MIISYSQSIEGDEARLDGSEHIHFTKVLRKSVGDNIYVTNGKGKLIKGILVGVFKKYSIIRLDSVVEEQKRGHRRGIAIAPTKNMDRMEWMVEKCTEIGVTDIFPVLCHRSERKIIKPERLQKIIVSAMKQSKNLHIPSLHPLMKVSEFLTKTNDWKNKYIAHCMEPKHHLEKLYERGEDAMVLIGPEGDFTGEEVKNALNSGWLEASLGEARLRTETAGIVSCMILNL